MYSPWLGWHNTASMVKNWSINTLPHPHHTLPHWHTHTTQATLTQRSVLSPILSSRPYTCRPRPICTIYPCPQPAYSRIPPCLSRVVCVLFDMWTRDQCVVKHNANRCLEGSVTILQLERTMRWISIISWHLACGRGRRSGTLRPCILWYPVEHVRVRAHSESAKACSGWALLIEINNCRAVQYHNSPYSSTKHACIYSHWKSS